MSHMTSREADVRNCHRKKVYESTEAARADAVQYSAEGNWERPLAPYRCPHCQLWHLTSRLSPAQAKRVRRWRARWASS